MFGDWCLQSESLPVGLEFFLAIMPLCDPGCVSSLRTVHAAFFCAPQLVDDVDSELAGAIEVFRRWARCIGPALLRGTSDERAYLSCWVSYNPGSVFLHCPVVHVAFTPAPQVVNDSALAGAIKTF